MLAKLVLILTVGAAVATAVELRAVNQDYRLPEGAVEVENYDIHLILDENIFTNNLFNGIAIITFKVVRPASTIKLHINNINFTAPIDLRPTGSTNQIALTNTEFTPDPDTDILTLTTNVQLAGETTYTLTFQYVAELRTREMYGFYKSYYYNEDNQQVFLGTTQFQPTHARKAFPSFDEPSYKATFNIKITHPRNYTALSNTNGEPVENQDNTVTTTFLTTPKMSTYLVAFIVSDFECTSSPAELSTTPHAVCSRRESAAHRQAAVEAGAKLIGVLESYTGIPYLESGIGKMHQVAIPDFSAGAMENWGLLTYRETGLLWDPEETSNSYLQSLENVVSHEITHMWFGNLVTCKWWSDTFLNEGFARLFQWFGTFELRPDWELDKQFVITQVHPMLVTDAQPSATALSSAAYTPSQVSGRFGSVSYNKGASVYRMLQHAMGPDNFRTGIHKYLTDNRLSATTPADLWAALQTTVPVDALPSSLVEVMDAWINTPGFPLLQVSLEGTNVIISQNRFTSSGQQTSDKWYVPVTYTLSSDTTQFENTQTKEWLLPESNLTIPNVISGNNDWIILNNQQIGFYRIRYDDDLLSRIEQALKTNVDSIHVLNRAQLVDDVYNLAQVDTYPYSRLFDFLLFLKNDTSYYSWYAAINAFSSMTTRTGSERIRNALSAYILELMAKVYESLPFETPNNDDQIYTLNRAQINTWACRLGNQNCITKAVNAFREYRTNEVKPDKNVKTVVYCNGLRHSESPQADWDFLWGIYSSTKLATEQATILNALGCSRDSQVLNGFLQKSINATSGIRQQDALSVFQTVYTQNPEGVDYAFDFLENNYIAISEYYGSMNSLNNMFSGLAGRFTHQDQITRLERFIESATDLSQGAKDAATAAARNARASVQFTERFERQLTSYFNLENDTGDNSSSRTGFAAVVIPVLMIFYWMWN